MTALVTKHLPLVAGAPDGIKKLRCLILELATCGRLVAQLASHSESVAGLPRGWLVKQVGEITECLDRLRRPITKQDRVPGSIPYYGASGVVDYVDDYIFDEPLVLVGEDGAKWAAGDSTAFSITGKAWVNNHVHVLKPDESQILGAFLVLSLVSKDLTPYITGMTVQKLNQARLNLIPVSVPPIEEQHCIVAKVDELMALCDRLEADQADAEAAHAQLVQALLDSLTQATDAADFRASWQRLSEHFHTLFTTEASIDALKQTVLQLAVMGKIAKQDLSSTEDGQDALGKIIAWRKQAVISKEIREPRNPVKAIGIDEHPYKLPDGWTWVRLGTLIYIQSGDGLTAANMRAGTIPVFGGNGINGYHDECNVVSRTLVIGRVGYYCGSIHITPENAWVTDNAFVTKFCADAVDIRFLYWLLKITNLKENDSATAQPVISGSKIYPIVVGLPPLEEQHRIVAKVDELMTLCDQLKAQLADAREQHAQLATALVEQAVA